MSSSPPNVVLEARGVTKRYPGTIALDSVNFRAYRNQVNVLIGENGAGKSTLVRILAGVEKPDAGQLFLEGSHIALRSPRDAARNGISIVHQELSIVPNLDLAENIFAARELLRAGMFVDRSLEEHRSAEALHHLRKPMNVSAQAGNFSLGCRQIVEVARALDQRAKILILDEPTSALSNAEADSLFNVITELKRAGVTIIYISHRLNELLHLGDFFTVLRSGCVVGEAARSEITRQWIVRRMSGRDLNNAQWSQSDDSQRPALLQVEELTPATSSDVDDNQPAHKINFAIRPGEILGIYGLLGAGRTELLEALAGFRPILSGAIYLRGRRLRISSVEDAITAGIHLVPEDRQRDGLIPELSTRENITLNAADGMFLHRQQETARARQLANELNIRASDLELPVSILSGGNQQKVLIARCLMRSPSLLLLDEPTRGVDVTAKAEIHGIMRRLALLGMSIIFSSSEIEETQALADRVIVLCQGRIAAELDRTKLTDEVLFAAASPTLSVPGVSPA